MTGVSSMPSLSWRHWVVSNLLRPVVKCERGGEGVLKDLFRQETCPRVNLQIIKSLSFVLCFYTTSSSENTVPFQEKHSCCGEKKPIVKHYKSKCTSGNISIVPAINKTFTRVFSIAVFDSACFFFFFTAFVGMKFNSVDFINIENECAHCVGVK